MNKPLFSNNLPFLFLCSAKCGSTSLTKWYIAQMGQLGVVKSPNYYRYLTVNQDEVIKSLQKEEKKVYKLTRKPYSRMVSCFFHIIRHPVLWEETGINGEKGLSFIKFLNELSKKDLRRGVANGHIAHQYIEGEKWLIDQYITLENLSSELRQIEIMHNLKHVPIEDLNNRIKYGDSEKEIDENLSDTVFEKDQVTKEIKIFSHKAFYSKEAKELVDHLYSIDFERYNYKKNLV
ncbi:sulfotransferase family 2 domain-containing protein [Bacillus carboniphilus]|uniref:Sulfotransferase family 2 domain-containing protein n=1 Tax=Bacillus carboniphilus TaxID=86663 RepID=A0ABY9JUQ8_9BACI|nr:sulfotransferase family 2 domain-containing protein [Bacillus carboniphilus]WLR42165.1 sulfotransferase family 2 domain-containing protein [Bacillus carboniphilus]